MSFGSVNVVTGELQKGYIKDSQMKFKKIPWYKRIFQKKPEKVEYVGTTTVYSQLIWSDKKHYFDVSVYRKINPITNETYEIFCFIEGLKYKFNIDAYVYENKLIIN